MLMPKRVKYRKLQRGRLKGKAYRGNTVAFGTFGLQSLEGHYVTSRQIEASRRAVVRYIRRGGKILDSHFSVQASDQTRRRDPHGFRQRQRGSLGGAGATGSGDLGDRRHS